MALLAEALHEAGRAEIDTFIGAALPALRRCDLPRTKVDRLLESVRTWPHRVDHEGAQAKLLAGVLLHWSSLDEADRGVVLTQSSRRLVSALRLAAEVDPRAASRVLESRPLPELGEIAVSLLTNPDRVAARAAAGTLLEMVTRVFAIEPSPALGDLVASNPTLSPASDSEQQQVISGLRAALGQFAEHRMREILLAALLLADGPASPGAKALGLDELIQTNHPVRGGLRTTIRLHPAPFVRERAWRWMRDASLRTAAVDRLGRTNSLLEHELLLGLGHLVLNPSRRHALLGAGAGVVPAPERIRELSAPARRWLPDVIEPLQIDPAVRSALRSSGLTDASVLVRLAHARTADLAEQVDLTFDADSRVARSACLARSPAGARSWVRWPMRPVDLQRARLAGKLTKSPHAQVRSIASQDSVRFDPWRVDVPESRLAAWEWLAADRSAFLVAIRARMAEGDDRQRAAAIRLARVLCITASLEQDLLDLAFVDESHAWVAATAVSALADATSTAARAGISRALAAGDDRVRANAVEAAVRCMSRDAGSCSTEMGFASAVLELKSDPHHRVRANALRGLMELGGGGFQPFSGTTDELDGVKEMLTDDREMHRLAGLWLTERTMGTASPARFGKDWEWVCRRVAGLASRDEDAAVRVRAVRCGRRLLGAIGSPRIEVRAAA